MPDLPLEDIVLHIIKEYHYRRINICAIAWNYYYLVQNNYYSFFR